MEGKQRLLQLLAFSTGPAIDVVQDYFEVKIIQQFRDFEQFLNDPQNKHQLFHKHYPKIPCCGCMPISIAAPYKRGCWGNQQFAKLYDEHGTVTAGHEKITRSQISQYCLCKVSAQKSVKVTDIDITLLNAIMQHCYPLHITSKISRWMKDIKEVRGDLNGAILMVRSILSKQNAVTDKISTHSKDLTEVKSGVTGVNTAVAGVDNKVGDVIHIVSDLQFMVGMILKQGEKHGVYDKAEKKTKLSIDVDASSLTWDEGKTARNLADEVQTDQNEGLIERVENRCIHLELKEKNVVYTVFSANDTLDGSDYDKKLQTEQRHRLLVKALTNEPDQHIASTNIDSAQLETHHINTDQILKLIKEYERLKVSEKQPKEIMEQIDEEMKSLKDTTKILITNTESLHDLLSEMENKLRCFEKQSEKVLEKKEKELKRLEDTHKVMKIEQESLKDQLSDIQRKFEISETESKESSEKKRKERKDTQDIIEAEKESLQDMLHKSNNK
ncbi:unnamed protein product [Mytilus coruscus]|uniref:DZIP3-like HEPN domain-containing protein n=1 Tax=Mytilus coruscus TaxID=42192 RepID=A0A6J8D9H0_MYTCO|nr:unnamed protein product [Mytilus coruscus]